MNQAAQAGTDTAGEVEAAGHFRIYLGAAPGVGKTYAMLSEAHRRQGRGADVVVGFVESYGRPLTEAPIDGLEVIPRKTVDYGGTRLEEMDLDAVLRRHPGVALIDELAHQRAGIRQERQTVAGHPGHPPRGNRRHHDRQHPASRKHRRRGGADDRDAGP